MDDSCANIFDRFTTLLKSESTTKSEGSHCSDISTVVTKATVPKQLPVQLPGDTTGKDRASPLASSIKAEKMDIATSTLLHIPKTGVPSDNSVVLPRLFDKVLPVMTTCIPPQIRDSGRPTVNIVSPNSSQVADTQTPIIGSTPLFRILPETKNTESKRPVTKKNGASKDGSSKETKNTEPKRPVTSENSASKDGSSAPNISLPQPKAAPVKKAISARAVAAAHKAQLVKLHKRIQCQWANKILLQRACGFHVTDNLRVTDVLKKAVEKIAELEAEDAKCLREMADLVAEEAHLLDRITYYKKVYS